MDSTTTNEVARGDTRPRVTNNEIGVRLRLAKAHMSQFTDSKTNRLQLVTSPPGYIFTSPHLDIYTHKDLASTDGRIEISGQVEGDPEQRKTLIDSFHEPKDISQATSNFKDMQKKRGLIATCECNRSSWKPSLSVENYEGQLQICVARGVSQDDLISAMDAPQKRALTIGVKNVNKTIWQSSPNGEPGRIEYGSPSISIDIPFSPDMQITDFIDVVNTIFAALRECRLLTLPEGTTIALRFAGDRQALELQHLGLNENEYQKAVTRIRSSTEKPSSPTDPYVQCFQKDLQRVDFFPYDEAVRYTRQVFPSLVSTDLVTRYELCEIGRVPDGQPVILLPASSYISPDIPYDLSQDIHSRIEETWHSPERIKLLNNLQSTASKPLVRGYIIELASGRRFLVVDPQKIDTDELVKRLKKDYGVEESAAITHSASRKASIETLERAIFTHQILKGIALDVARLKQAGATPSDLTFYKHWATRFYVTKEDRLDATYASVTERFNELLRRISKSL